MASDLTSVTFTHGDLAGNAMWYFGVYLPAAGTSNPQRCRCADMLTDLPRSRWRGGGGRQRGRDVRLHRWKNGEG